MGWEWRKGRRYYYRKEREGGKVISRYIGSGETARLVAQLEGLDRDRANALRELWRRERQRLREEEQAIDAYCRQVGQILREALEAAGYRQHKRGAWRKQHDGQTKQDTRPGREGADDTGGESREGRPGGL